MRHQSLQIRLFVAAAVLLQPFVAQTAHADRLLSRLGRLVSESKYQGTPPCTGQDCAIECLAENIDWLEHYIDTYGSVVAKQPDIWGEARLTKHRDEYERMMFGELNQFDETINAAIAQGDSSFLAQALALSAAAGGTATAISGGTSTSTATTVEAGGQNPGVSTTATTRAAPGFTDPATTFAPFGDKDKRDISLEPVLYLDQMSRYLHHLHELRRINEGDDTSDSPGYSLNLVRIPVSILPGKLTRQGFGAEVTVTATPVISDDLMPTTFRNLVVNDVVDQLRLPVTRIAEYLQYESERKAKSDELDKRRIALLEKYHQLRKKEEALLAKKVERQRELAEAKKMLNEIPNAPAERLSELAKIFLDEKSGGPGIIAAIESPDVFIQQFNLPAASLRDGETLPELIDRAANMRTEQLRKTLSNDVELRRCRVERDMTAIERDIAQLERQVEQSKDEIALVMADLEKTKLVIAKLLQVPLTGGRARRAKNPIPPTQLLDVHGDEELQLLSKAFCDAYNGRHIRWNGCENCQSESGNPQECRTSIVDVQRWLDAETDAAYEMLRQTDHVQLLAALAAPASGLARQIRSEHFVNNTSESLGVKKYRHYFFGRLHQHRSPDNVTQVIVGNPNCELPVGDALLCDIAMCAVHEAQTAVEALAWAIVVESALLNERLNQDVRKLAKAKEVYELNTQRDYIFFLPDSVLTPNTGLEYWQGEFNLANEIFKQYVKERWPIHVFAVDPREQDQNVASVSQRKRELQFALALGFATGKIGANSLTQYSRKLETSIETIDLNRTIVGFGHGNDTFGWRFHPRVQPLDVPGTFGSLRETLAGTSRDYDLRHRQLEPGQRECVAVVLMPSFVPYADFDIRSNWFKLTNPKNAALTMKDTVKLSRAVTAMRNSRAQCAQCQHLYREGELRRLFVRVDQLDRELPLQTQRALVPYENTLGGFEMFNTGVTDLAPELIGWYGAPGVNTNDGYDCGCKVDCGSAPAACTSAECKEVATKVAELETKIAELAEKPPADRGRQQPLPPCEGVGTTLFLVGDNFSVHDTKVIAGGVCIPHVRLISRELMRVTIPSCVNTVHLCENGKTNEYVSVYVATPYGVTNHLHVPVIPAKKPPKTEEQIEAEIARRVAVAVTMTEQPNFSIGPVDPCYSKLLVYASGEKADSADLKFAPAPSARHVNLLVKSSPKLENGTSVELYAAFLEGGKYLNSPVKIVGCRAPIVGRAFPSTGSPESEQALMKALEAYSRDDLKAGGGKKTVSLVYYPRINGVWSRQPLADPLAVELHLVAPKPGEKQPKAAECESLPLDRSYSALPAAPSTPGTLPTVAPPQPVFPPEPVRTPAVSGEEAVLPLNRPSTIEFRGDCGCGDRQAAVPRRLPVVSVAHHEQRIPARFAQSSELLPTPAQPSGSVALSDVTMLTEQFNQRLDRLQATLPTEAQQRDIIRQEVARLAAERAPRTDAMVAQPMVNVTTAPPPPATDNKWWHDENHPLMNQMKIKAGERWRNLRDQLPCY